MFLNLKGKKYVEAVTQQQSKQLNHPKTHRDQVRDKQRREAKEVKEVNSYRQHNHSKNQPTSTAVNTLQPSNASYSNIGPHFKIKIKDHSEQEPLKMSQEKLDSYRLARVTSAYKKIKRVEGNDGSFAGEEKSQERARRTMSKTGRQAKKEVSQLVQNYICVTEPVDQDEIKVTDNIGKAQTQALEEMISPFLELFSQSKQQSFKERSYSERDLDIKRSLDKSGRLQREVKKKSNEILIRDQSQSRQHRPEVSMHAFVSTFEAKLERVRGTLNRIGGSKKYRNLQQSHLVLFQSLHQDIQSFVHQMYELCIIQMDSELKKYENAIKMLAQQQEAARKDIARLSQELYLEKERSKSLEGLMTLFQDRSLYSTIFLNELSFSFDVDSHLRQKLFDEAKKNGLVSDTNESCVSENTFQRTQSLKADPSGSVYFDSSKSQLEGYNVAGFGNCVLAKDRRIKDDGV